MHTVALVALGGLFLTVLALLPAICMACLLRVIVPPLRDVVALDYRRRPTLVPAEASARTE